MAITPAPPSTVRHPQARRRARPGVLAALLAHPAPPRLALLLALVAALLLGLAPLGATPAVVPASAPATAFSAERALQHLRVIAHEPHPMGSPEHAATVAYVVDQLRALGLEPHVQVASTTGPAIEVAIGSVPAGRVINIVARLPGYDSTGAILLVGNYDSMPTTPGAGDPGTSAAVVLEALRAVRAGPPLRNDLIVAFIDAEPNGLIGDEAFVAAHPWARDVNLVLSFANSGIGGAVALETTTPAGQRFLADILRVAPLPLAYSSLTGLMRALGGGGPLLWIARAHDTPGAEFVSLDGPQTYHTLLNSVERLDPRLVQHHGAYALALTRHFGDRPLVGPGAPDGEDLVFFTVAPGQVVAYPAVWAGPLAGLVGLSLVVVLALGLWRRRLSGRGLVAGLLAFPLAAAGVVIATSLAWWAIKTLDSDHQVFLIGVAYNADVYHIGLIALGVATMAGCYAWLARWCRPLNLAAGALPWLAVAMGLTSLSLPGLSYLFTWPLLAAVLVLGWLLLAPSELTDRPWPRAAVLAGGALPAIILVTPFVHALFGLLIRMDTFLPVPVGSATLAVVGLTLGLLLPALTFLGGARPWLVPGAAALAGLLVIVFASVSTTFNAAYPRPTTIAYVLDTDSGAATWVTTDRYPDAWTRQLIPAGATPGTFLAMPNANPDRVWPAWQAPAPPVALAAPDVAVMEEGVSNGQHTLRLRLTSPRGAPNLYLDVQAAAPIRAAALDGRPLDLSAWPAEQRSRFRMAYHALPAEGVEVSLTVAAVGPLRLRLEDRSNGLPAVPGLTISPRPADTVPAPFELADPTIVSRTVTLSR